ncbi:uncharacterized protein LOC125947482 [Dermacentor silvarum]|uniref:uncharacterized protein LOC125947482 n=1 Tax=Dermacentor silvarum TaxID=543639 RepID=UPI0021018C6D|nr:uncharacterized protein LOC125947482 [Dermacentor silvarum]
MDYERLAEGINGSVAISTTVGVVNFGVIDGKSDVGSSCSHRQVLERSDKVCKDLGFTNDYCDATASTNKYLCNTNATAQELFVNPKNGSTSTSWKFNIAFFDIEMYMPGNDTSCPKLNLADFYRSSPKELHGRSGK